jgi:hypothetical protein
MNVRLNYGRVAPGVYHAMEALDSYLAACGLEASLLDLWNRLSIAGRLAPGTYQPVNAGVQ